MIDLDNKKLMFARKIIDLDTKAIAKKAIVTHVFEIDGSAIDTAKVLINQDTTMLFQIVMLVFVVCCLRTIVFLLLF